MEHKHLIIRAELNSPPTNPKIVKKWLTSLVSMIGMNLLKCVDKDCNPIAGYCNILGNRGLTAVALIETSHIVLHTWDEATPAIMQLDVYTCSTLDIDVVLKAINEFDVQSITYKLFDREYKLDLIQEI